MTAGQTGRAAAGALVARSRRPARATAATAVLRLTSGMTLTPSLGGGPATVPAETAEAARVAGVVAGMSAPGLPAAPGWRGAHPGDPAAAYALGGRVLADSGPADPGGTDIGLASAASVDPALAAAHVPAGQDGQVWRDARSGQARRGGRGGHGGRPRPDGTAAAAVGRAGGWDGTTVTAEAGPTPPAGSPAGPAAGSTPSLPTDPSPATPIGRLPGHDAAHTESTAAVAVPGVLARTSGTAPEGPHHVMTPSRDIATSPDSAASPLVDRVRRPALSAAPDPAGQLVWPANAAVPGAPPAPAPERADYEAAPAIPAPTVPAPSASQRDATSHPPVTIGEIHVHVAEPAPAGADPLALLAPYARGLTARRDGAL